MTLYQEAVDAAYRAEIGVAFATLRFGLVASHDDAERRYKIALSIADQARAIALRQKE